MQRLFCPRSIAVIGSSGNVKKLGHIVSKNIIESGYRGNLFLINPTTSNILGYSTKESVSKITEVIDLSIFVIPSNSVLKVIEELGEQKKVNNVTETTYAVIISAGFKETGQAGSELETELLELASSYNIKVVGPNCLGVMNLAKDKYAFNGSFGFLPALSGNISLVSQSGALISVMIEQAQSLGFGFNKIISLGNKGDINENDLVTYLNTDDSTEVIALYLESFENGKDFYNLLKNTTKPVVILKSGRSQIAKKAASSHTGSIAGDQRVSEAFLDSTLAVDVYTLDEFFDTLNIFRRYQNLDDNKVVVCTNAGGLGVIALDGLSGLDLDLQEIIQELKTDLSSSQPDAAGINNPIDILGDADADRYDKALSSILKTYPKASLLIILTPQVSTQVDNTAEVVCQLSLKYPKATILPIFIGGEMVKSALQKFEDDNLPYFSSPERCLRALNNLWWFSNYMKSSAHNSLTINSSEFETITKEIDRNILANSRILNFQAVSTIAKVYDLNLPRYINLTNKDDLKNIFNVLGTPIVAKSVSADILHRTEKRAVVTDITNIQQIEEFLKNNHLQDTIFQESIQKGVEVFAGIQLDENFGQVLVVGSGGIYAEIMDDFALAPLPKTVDQVREVFAKTKISKVFNNYRNVPLNSDSLYQSVFNLCKFSSQFPQITSIDANPIIVTKSTAYVVDLKMSLIQV
ncbi:MAG: acetate--CoA ligase family protein [Patescibacteria group bacterium]